MKSLKAFPFFLILGALISVLMFLKESGKAIPIQIFSIQGAVQLKRLGTWTVPQTGIILNPSDRLRTGDNASAVLKFPSGINVLVQGGSEIAVAGPSFKNQNIPSSLSLSRGSILAASGSVLEPAGNLVVITPRAEIKTSGAFFKVDVRPERNGREWYGTLRGTLSINLKNTRGGRALAIPALRKFENLLENQKEEGLLESLPRGAGMFGDPVEDAQPENLETREWTEMFSAYESFTGTRAGLKPFAGIAGKQGPFWNAVYEENGFYASERGYLEQRFFQSEKGESRLLIYYDVYPGGSFVGVDFKIQSAAIPKHAFLNFDVRSIKGEGVPQTVFMELRSNHQVLKTFELNSFTDAWSRVRLPLAEAPALDEIVILLKPDRTGPDKQGMLEFSNLAL